MSQKKFGQLKVVVWFPEPEGGRYEEWTNENKSREDFEKCVNGVIERLRKFVPPPPEGKP